LDIANKLAQIQEIEYYLEACTDELPEWFNYEGVTRSDQFWQCPCTHKVRRPATDSQIESVGKRLGFEIPEAIRNLLKTTDGADLFTISHRHAGFPEEEHTRYHLLSHAELKKVNVEMHKVYKLYLEMGTEPDEYQPINYLAFCDVWDGNYLAMTLQGGSIFFLDHEYGCYPYGIEFTREAYLPVADSLGNWLAKLIDTNGGDGMGGAWIPL
jgi:hypothetical protein